VRQTLRRVASQSELIVDRLVRWSAAGSSRKFDACPSIAEGVRGMAKQPSVGAEISEQELVQRKAFLEFRDDDLANLMSINDVARQYADSMIDDFYKHLLSFEETSAFFHDPQVLERVKRAQQHYFLRLTQGNYDLAYAENRLNIGAIHERIGLPVKAYLGMYNYYLRAVATRLAEAYRDAPKQAWTGFLSLMKLTFLDIGLAIDTYINSRERTIREQQEAIQELPTPRAAVSRRYAAGTYYRVDRLAARAGPHGAAPKCRSRQSREGGGNGYHRRAGSRFESRKSPGANG
jgi:hypothetical protein